MINTKQELQRAVKEAVQAQRITDIHTHIYSPCFKDLLLWGIDELLTYHYLVAEFFRITDMSYDEFWSLSKRQQADAIWETLFIDNTPYSEACRGVLSVLKLLNLDVSSRNLDSFREYFDSITVEEYINVVFKLSNVESVVMTNDPFDDKEREIWEKSYVEDKRFKAALRIDPLLNDWESSFSRLNEWGYETKRSIDEKTIAEVKRFLNDWIKVMNPLYMAVSLPPSFKMPEDSARGRIIENCILPVCREHNIPFALMIGVKKLVNPDLRLAGDSVGKGDIDTVEYLCSNFNKNKFMVTMLSRENQHELCISARKYRNLMIFGCWWFLNNPSIIEEMTRERFELLGSSFIPQHSDARVLDQLIYKWNHSKKIIQEILIDKYSDILDSGWEVSEDEIKRDVDKLFNSNFDAFINKQL